MHLDDISLLQVIVSSNYNVSWKIFSRWSMQLLDESPLFATDDVSIEFHVSYTIIDWLTHNNARNEITLRFISFLNVICCTFCRLCRSLLFTAVRIAGFIVLNYLLIIFFCHLSIASSVTVLRYRSLSSGTDRLGSRS